MVRRSLYLVSTSLLLGLSGCPVTDDYYLLSSDAVGASGGSNVAGKAGSAGQSAGGSPNEGGKAPQAGSSTGGTPAAGTPAAGTPATGGDLNVGGDPNLGQAGIGDAGSGGDGLEPCVAKTERCNGHDDDCDGITDEDVCPMNCSGFVLPSSPEHGYMYCFGVRKANWSDAKMACESQDMRLAWLDSAEENAAVAVKLDSLSADAEVLFGATDMASEGDWIWFGGDQFWKGTANGVVVGGRYNNWPDGTPNNANNNEDCALIIVESGNWGDRACYATYPYVCEQPD